jgi:hypothetical protein
MDAAVSCFLLDMLKVQPPRSHMVVLKNAIPLALVDADAKRPPPRIRLLSRNIAPKVLLRLRWTSFKLLRRLKPCYGFSGKQPT